MILINSLFPKGNITEHFTESEVIKVSHPEGATFEMDERLFQLLEYVRNQTKAPITLTSGFRNPEYNKKIGGVPGSLHRYGKAIDFKGAGVVEWVTHAVENKTADFRNLENIGLGGVGIYDSFIHFDTRPGNGVTTWKKKTETLVDGENNIWILLLGVVGTLGWIIYQLRNAF